MDQQEMPIVKGCSQSMASDVTLPGFGYNDLDPQERTTLYAMAKCAEGARVLTYVWLLEKDGNNSTYMKLKGPDYLIYVKSCYYEIYPAFFERKYLYKPVKCISSIVNLGKTSFQHLTDVVSLATKETLFRCMIGGVRVAKSTRRPASISDEFIQSVGREMKTCAVPKLDKLTVPEGSFHVDFVASWIDCDGYKHVNHGSYLRFCQSAAEQLEWSKELPGYNSSHVREIQSTYYAESSSGHKLKVSAWREGRRICFDIFNSTNQETAYQATFDLTPSALHTAPIVAPAHL